MELDESAGRTGRGLINAGEFGPAVGGGGFRNVARILGFRGWADADRVIAHNIVDLFDGFVRVVAPEHARDDAAARRCDVFRAAPRAEPIMLAGRDRKTFLPPPIQTGAVVMVDNEGALAGLAA